MNSLIKFQILAKLYINKFFYKMLNDKIIQKMYILIKNY